MLNLISKPKSFSVFRLIIGNQTFKFSDFNVFDDTINWDERIDGKIIKQTLISKKTYENRFVCFYFTEGGTLPRADTVFNITTEIDEDNPRQENQIERKDQLFFMLDCQTQKIYLSHFNKKHYIENLLYDKFLGKRITIKSIIDANNFLQTINSVKQVSLSATPSLLTTVGCLGEALQYDSNNYGDTVDNLELIITYKDPKNLGRKQNSRVKDFLNDLIRQRENQAISKLQITGNSDENFERVFNAESIVDKINIRVPIESNGFFDDNKVFSFLINKIYEQEGD